MTATMLDFVVWAQVGGPGGNRPPFNAPGNAPANPNDIMNMIMGAGIGALVFFLIIVAFSIIVMWKIFTKAGEPGWAAIVPIYNMMILSKICGRGELFGLLTLVPCVGIVVAIMLIFDLARVFGKGPGFAVGMLLLGIVFYPMLAFGSAEYIGPDGGSTGGRRRRDEYDDEEEEDERPRRRRIAAEDEEEQPRRRPAAPEERVKRPAPPPPAKPKRRPVDEDDE